MSMLAIKEKLECLEKPNACNYLAENDHKKRLKQCNQIMIN